MRTIGPFIVLSAAFLPFGVSSYAQDYQPSQMDEADSVIMVTAAGQTFRARGGELRAAQRAFRKFRERYAPDAELVLQLHSPTMTAADLRDLDLWLVSKDERIPLELDQELRFRLPELKNDDWEITTRRKGLRLQVSPWVFSPGSKMGDWRLGDLKLQCRVAISVLRQSLNVAQSTMFGLAGGCENKRTAVWQEVPNKIQNGMILEDGRQQSLEVQDRSFRLPSYVDDFSNEARVRLVAAEPR